MLSSENQMLQLPLVVHRAEVNTGFSDSLECDAPDAAEPVSQVLPDTAMELWDFGGDEQPEPKYAVAGAGDDSRAAEALEELEDFCRCLDLENDAAAANSMLPELRLDNPTNASIAKLPLPHAKQDTMATAQHRLLPNGQQAPSNQQQQEQQQEGGSVAQAGVGSDAKQHGAAPTGWVTPAQMIFPRAAIFYCSSFSASCGLPKHNMLVRLGEDVKGAQVLYTVILQQRAAGSSSSSSSIYQRGKAQKQAPLPPPPRQIPRKHHVFVTALGQVLGRAGKCPFGLLLQRHCPLPDVLLPQGTRHSTLPPPNLNTAPAQGMHEHQPQHEPQQPQQQQPQQQHQQQQSQQQSQQQQSQQQQSQQQQSHQQQQQQQPQQRQQKQELPSTVQLDASNHPIISDAANQLPSHDALMHSPTSYPSQQGTAECSPPCLADSVGPPRLTPTPSPNPMSTFSNSGSATDCTPAAEPMTQDLVIADSDDDTCMGPVPADSACLSGLRCVGTAPERLCLELSPDTLPELTQQVGDGAGVLEPPVVSHAGMEGALWGDADPAREHRVVHGIPMHDPPSSPWDQAIPMSLMAAPRSLPVGGASGNRTDGEEEQRPGLSSAVTADTAHATAHCASVEGVSIAAAMYSVKASAPAAVQGGAGTAARDPCSKPTLCDLPFPGGDQLQQSLLDSHVPHEGVTAFLWSAVRHIVPQALLGDAASQRSLRGAVHHFVCLRRYEQMSVHQALQGIKLSTVTAISSHPHLGKGPPSQVAAQGRLLALWVRWLFSELVIPLIRAHFYCTESEAHRQEVLYFRKPVWAKLKSSAYQGLTGKLYTQLTTRAAQACLQSRSLGIAKLRLLPKKTGLRPIANLGSTSVVLFPGGARTGLSGKRPRRQEKVKLVFKPVNKQLQSVLQVLKHETACQPHSLGGSVFGYNDAYRRLHTFLRQWRAAQASPPHSSPAPQHASPPNQQPHWPGSASPITQQNQMSTDSRQVDTAAKASDPELVQVQQSSKHRLPIAGKAERDGKEAGSRAEPYIVSVDVSRAFDNVDVDLLLGIVEPLLRSPEYLILKYTELAPHLGGVRTRYRTAAVDASLGFAGFPNFLQGAAQNSSQKVYSDQVVYSKVTRSATIDLLREHLQRNIVRIGKQWHYQSNGIPQGSCLSTLLCSLFLADLEMNHLQDLLPQPPWQPHPTPTQPHPGPTLTSSSGGHLTDLAQAAHTRTDTQLHPSTTLSTSLSQPSPSRSPKDEPHPHISSINLNPETHSTPCAQSARAASCQSPGKADWWREDTFDHQPNAKRTRVGQSDCQPALAVSGSRAQVVPSCRHGTTGAADPDPNQQANSDCGRGQQACVLGGFPAEEDGQSSLSGVGVWEVPVQQGGAEGACLKGGLQRRAPRLQSLLMRLIDDFLFITPSRTAAEALVNKLLKGFADYGVSVNPSKTRLSFQMVTSSGASLQKGVYRDGAGSSFIKWCGLLINTSNLELQADYTRYAGLPLSSTLTVPLSKKPGQQLCQKLCHYLQPKCHPLVLDVSISSSTTAFLLAAMKFHCYMKALPVRAPADSQLAWLVIQRGIDYLCNLVRARVQGARTRYTPFEH
ncbi:hypothetical protein ABBQ32_006906 [Trebouxia sp. C0010 RCD-2024]